MSGVAAFLAVPGLPSRNQGALTLTHGSYELAYAETSELTPGLTNLNKYSTYTDFPVTNAAGNWAAVDRDFLCLIVTTGNLQQPLAVARFRRAPGAFPTTLQFGEFGPVDRGVNNLLAIANLQTLGTGAGSNKLAFIALRAVGLFQVPPKITFSGGVATYYKDFDFTYNGENNTPEPVVNLGNHLVLFGTGTQPYFSGGLVIPWSAYYFGSSYSSAVVAMVGYWDGADPTSVSGVTSSQFTLSNLYPGYHIVKIVVTAASGKTFTAYRSIWVFQDDNQIARTQFDYPIPVLEVKSDRHTIDGRQIELTLAGATYNTLVSAPTSRDLAHGAMVIYFERTMQAPYDPAPVVTQMPGWLQESTSTLDANTYDGQFTLYGPGNFLNQGQATAFMFTNIGAGAPSDWYSITSALANTQFTTAYILDYHVRGWRQLFDLHLNLNNDALGYATQFPGSFSSIPPNGSNQLQYILINQGTILEQIRNLVKRNLLSFNIDSNGHMWLLPDPAFQHPSLYPASPVTLLPSNFAKMEAKHTLRPITRAVRGEGLAYDGTNTSAYLADATGPVPSQGQNDQSLQLQMLSNNGTITNAQQELNMRVALLYMQLNNPWGQITLQIPRNEARFDPAQYPVVRFNLINFEFSVADLPELILDITDPWWAVVTAVDRSHKEDGVIDTTVTIALLPEMAPSTTSPTLGAKVNIPPVTT